MEAVVAAALAAVAATKEIALSPSIAAAAAEEEEEAAATGKEAAAAASVAALDAKEKAAARQAASAAALDAEEADGVLASTAAAMRTSKKRKFDLIDDGGTVDHISRLRDDELRIIVSLLPTKDGARTQAISRRWRPIWRSAPLNLVADRELGGKSHTTIDLIPKILSEHRGTARRFSLSLDWYCRTEGWRQKLRVEGWLMELNKLGGDLEELELTYRFAFRDRTEYLLPPSTYGFAPKLRVAKFGGFHFPNLIAPLSLEFPCLKQLTLDGVTISEGALQSMLSGSPALESLELKVKVGFGRLCISSQTLKSIGFCSVWRWTKDSDSLDFLDELVIKDTPSLERFLLLDSLPFSPTIQIISAPELKILGMLVDIPELYFGTTLFKKMYADSLTTKMHSMRVLVLESFGSNLDSVVNLLKCFPCLESLYVIFQTVVPRDNVRQYDLLDPIECLELHLKKVVLKNYDGTKSESIDFAKFLVLNAKVLKEMKITLSDHREETWFAKQRHLLQIRNRASKDAQFELKCGGRDYIIDNWHTHDLSMVVPFDIPSRGCSKCSCGPF